jgi:hypothetical protein
MQVTLEDAQLFRFELIESARSEDGRLRAKGEFARADVPTANRRLYTGKLWEREISRLGERIKNRSCYGMLDHPKDGRTTLREASHLITDLNFDGNRVVGEMEVLDTPNGKILESIIKSGGVVGVSSRGVGTTKKNPSGADVVQDDYKLLSFDFVADPANATSWPQFTTEDTDPEGTMALTLERLKKEHPELVQQIQAESVGSVPSPKAMEDKLRKEMEQRLVDMVAEQRTEAVEQARGEMLSDPDVAGSKVALESVVRLLRPFLLDEDGETLVRDRDEAIDQCRGQLAAEQAKTEKLSKVVDGMMAVSEEIGCRYYMERSLGLLEDNESKERIVTMMGDVSRFGGDFDGFKKALNTCVESLKGEAERAEEENTRVEEAEARAEKAEAALAKAMQLSEALAARAYAERKLNNHPHAPALRDLIQESNPTSKEQVDSLFESWGESHQPSEQFESLRSKLAGGREHLLEDEEDALAGGDDMYEGMELMGVSVKELRQRSGLPVDGGAKDRLPY